MTLRIDRARIPPGLISSAQTFSLILDETGLYTIRTGPAGSGYMPRRGLERMVAQAVANKVLAKVVAGEERLDEVGPEGMVNEKHSAFYTFDQVNLLKIKPGTPETELRLQLNGKKRKFLIPSELQPEIDQLVARLGG